MSLFKGRIILAPMVRVGNVGFRIFCATHGADIVFSEEIVAVKLSRCRREIRVYDPLVGPMVEFVTYEVFKDKYKRTVVFTTPLRTTTNLIPEGAPVVLQLGVSNPEVGASSSLCCCEDVDGIDVNMGCPKKFSVNNGMGAALMSDPSRAGAILCAIDDAINSSERVKSRGRRVPISFKIRLLDTAEETATLLTAIMEKVGPDRVHAITIHARTREQDSDKPPLYDRAATAVKALRRNPLFKNICFVLNGSIKSRADAIDKMNRFEFDGAMIARQAMWDMSVFSTRLDECGNNIADVSSPAPCDTSSWIGLYSDLLRYHAKYRVPFMYVKYHLTRSIPCITAIKHLMVAVQQEANSYEDAGRILGLTEEEQHALRGRESAEFVSRAPSLNSNDQEQPQAAAECSIAKTVARKREEDDGIGSVVQKIRTEQTTEAIQR